jgi:hypothetical protein
LKLRAFCVFTAIQEAEEMARQTVLPSTKSEHTSGIRENKAAEKAEIRKSETFSLGDIQNDMGDAQNGLPNAPMQNSSRPSKPSLRPSVEPKKLLSESNPQSDEEATHPITALIKKMVEADYED